MQFAQFLPRWRTAHAVRALFGIPISAGTVSAFGTKAAAGLAGFTCLLRDLLRARDVVGFDETSLRVDGANYWVHTASTPDLTLLTVHQRRGCQGADAAGALPGFTGVAVHDAWAPYDTYDDAWHSLCCAHILRELVAVTETSPTGGQWAHRVAEVLRELNKACDLAREQGRDHLDPQQLADAARRYTAAVTVGFNVSSGARNEIEKKTQRSGPPDARPAR